MEREEAIKIVKSHYPANKQMLNEALEFLIPELKESEDERIRKALITFFQRFPYDSIEKVGTNAIEALAWLEKQGEKKPVDKVKPKFNVGDVMRTLQEAADGMVDGMPVIISIDKEYYHCTNELIAIKDQDDYEFPPINVKQKPTWSEEDEEILKNLIDYFSLDDGLRLSTEETVDWIKSLKERLS